MDKFTRLMNLSTKQWLRPCFAVTITITTFMIITLVRIDAWSVLLHHQIDSIQKKNSMTFYDILQGIGKQSCKPMDDSNYLWLMFIGDSNTRGTVLALIQDVGHQVRINHFKFDSKIVIKLESINESLKDRHKMELIKKALNQNNSKHFNETINLIKKYNLQNTFDWKWIDREWILKIYNRDSSKFVYYIRISFRFMMNWNGGKIDKFGKPIFNPSYNMSKFKWIASDFDNFGFF